MSHQQIDPFIIKIETDEDELTHFSLGLEESINKTNSCNEEKENNQSELIEYLRLKQKITKNQLKVVAYRSKLRHAHAVLLRNRQLKKIKSLSNENSNLKQKINQMIQLTGRLNNLCDSFNSVCQPKKINRRSTISTNNLNQTINTSKSINPTTSIVSKQTVSVNQHLTQTEIQVKKPSGRPVNKSMKLLSKVKLTRQLNENVFKSFKKNGNIRMGKCTQEQLNEIDFINKSFENYLISKGYETTSVHSILKSKLGYNFWRRCRKSACKGSWCLKVNLNEACAHLCSNKHCKHINISSH